MGDCNAGWGRGEAKPSAPAGASVGDVAAGGVVVTAGTVSALSAAAGAAAGLRDPQNDDQPVRNPPADAVRRAEAAWLAVVVGAGAAGGGILLADLAEGEESVSRASSEPLLIMGSRVWTLWLVETVFARKRPGYSPSSRTEGGEVGDEGVPGLRHRNEPQVLVEAGEVAPPACC